jgi:hypothetical protein
MEGINANFIETVIEAVDETATEEKVSSGRPFHLDADIVAFTAYYCSKMRRQYQRQGKRFINNRLFATGRQLIIRKEIKCKLQ